MATMKGAVAATGIVSPEVSFESIELVQPAVPSLRIKLTGPDAPTITTEGIPGVTVVEKSWSEIVDDVIKLVQTVIGGGGGGERKCWTVTIDHPNGSTDTVKHCEAA
jgi:hypothetical protein